MYLPTYCFTVWVCGGNGSPLALTSTKWFKVVGVFKTELFNRAFPVGFFLMEMCLDYIFSGHTSGFSGEHFSFSSELKSICTFVVDSFIRTFKTTFFLLLFHSGQLSDWKQKTSKTPFFGSWMIASSCLIPLVHKMSSVLPWRATDMAGV